MAAIDAGSATPPSFPGAPSAAPEASEAIMRYEVRFSTSKGHTYQLTCTHPHVTDSGGATQIIDLPAGCTHNLLGCSSAGAPLAPKQEGNIPCRFLFESVKQSPEGKEILVPGNLGASNSTAVDCSSPTFAALGRNFCQLVATLNEMAQQGNLSLRVNLKALIRAQAQASAA